MIKISKNTLFNLAQIRVSGVKCNFNNIVKIIDIFDFKWIVMTVDSLTKNNMLLSFLKHQGWKCYIKEHKDNYVEVSAVIPYSSFADVLGKALDEDPENIFVFNFLDSIDLDIHLQHSFEELVTAGITDVFISVSMDENALLISANKSLLQTQDLYRKIKALRFDRHYTRTP